MRLTLTSSSPARTLAEDGTRREPRCTGPAGRNFRRWPILNRRVLQNPAARGSYTAETRNLRRWLVRRMTWMDRAANVS